MSSSNTTHPAVLCHGDAPWEVSAVPRPTPASSEVLIRVLACGLCGGDSVLRSGAGSTYPLVPGHEVVGVIEELGENVESAVAGRKEGSPWKWRVGMRVGVAWNAGKCGECHYCRNNNPQGCHMAHATALTRHGGLATYKTAHHTALVPWPEALPPTQAPLLCAGLTVFNALRNSRACKPGATVAILGLGGLGSIAVPIARALGLTPIVISHSPSKRAAASELGAAAFIDGKDAALAERIRGAVDKPWGGDGPGGVDLVLATSPEGETMEKVCEALAMDAEILLLGEPPSLRLSLPLMPLLLKRASVRGWTAGIPSDAYATLLFCLEHGIRARVRTIPLKDAEQGYQDLGKEAGRTVVVLEDA